MQSRDRIDRRRTLEPASKVLGANHRQQRAAFESDTGHSVFAVGMPLHAPHLPFAIPGGIGSIGRIAGLHWHPQEGPESEP